MKVPLSWLREFVEIDVPAEQLAHLLTVAGLEVEELRYVGLPAPEHNRYGFKITGGPAWDPARLVVADVKAIHSHPDAARSQLVVCEVYDGIETYQVVAGGGHLLALRDQLLVEPVKIALAREGTIYRDHQRGRGDSFAVVESREVYGVHSTAMICSEFELSISDEHQEVMVLDDVAPLGLPLIDYMGDIVFSIQIDANQGRNANVLGVAREISAQTGKPLRKPQTVLSWGDDPVTGRVECAIEDPNLNPRMMLALVDEVRVRPSPAWVQRRLKLAGVRPINNVIDATNYAMLEVGEPLHAFDWDKLLRRAGGRPIGLKTRHARPGETLSALNGNTYELTPLNVVVCDEQGPLSIAGVMGGAETAVDNSTTRVLLEAAAWDFISIRRTSRDLNLQTEAAFRFMRGVHPAWVVEGLHRGLYWLTEWSGGQVAPEPVDIYPEPLVNPTIEISVADVQRWLGLSLTSEEIASLLCRLDFTCYVQGDVIAVMPPLFRLDISQGLAGVADIMEEIARVYGLDNLPEQPIDEHFPEVTLAAQERVVTEDKVKDVLADLGFQEIITYRMIRPEMELKLWPDTPVGAYEGFVGIANSKQLGRVVLRRSLLGNVLSILERNAIMRDSLSMFEVGPVYRWGGEGLPAETWSLALAMTGRRQPASWDGTQSQPFDFFSLKGIVETLMQALSIPVSFGSTDCVSLHPGRSVSILASDVCIGHLGELHPVVQEHFEFAQPVLVGELDLDALLGLAKGSLPLHPVSKYAPLYEAVSFVIDERLPAAQAEAVIRSAGAPELSDTRLVDVYRGVQISQGQKSLTFELTYESMEPLEPQMVAKVRSRIMRQLEDILGAKVRT